MHWAGGLYLYTLEHASSAHLPKKLRLRHTNKIYKFRQVIIPRTQEKYLELKI